MPPKEIVLCVEGEGDVDAVPILAKRVLKEMDASGEVVIASLIFRVRGVGALVRGSGNEWLRHLENAKRQKHLAGVLLVLDGDLEHVPKTWDEYVRRFGALYDESGRPIACNQARCSGAALLSVRPALNSL